MWNTDLGGEVRQEGDVHLLTLNREVLVEALRGAFREVDGGLVFLRGDTHAGGRLRKVLRSKVSDCLMTVGRAAEICAIRNGDDSRGGSAASV